MAKQYKTVAEMVQAMDLPAAQKKRQIEYLHARRLSRMLAVMRAQKEMSQTQASRKLGWSQGRVSKLEKKEDRAVSVGDLLDYSEMLGMQLSISFQPSKMKIVDQIKTHASEMQALMQRLVRLCKGDDKAMTDGVERFHDECLVNLMGMITGSKKSLKAITVKKEFTVVGPPVKESSTESKGKELLPA